MVGRTKAPNAAQRRRLDRLSRMACIACLLNAPGTHQPNKTEVHHLVDKGTRELSGGHDATIPLCAWHHRGKRIRLLANDFMMAQQYGPSLALQKHAFVERYGTERHLLAIVDETLKITEKISGTFVAVGDVVTKVVAKLVSEAKHDGSV